MAGARQETWADPATADREIVISRVIDAPRELVFEGLTEVRHLSREAVEKYHAIEGGRRPNLAAYVTELTWNETTSIETTLKGTEN